MKVGYKFFNTFGQVLQIVRVEGENCYFRDEESKEYSSPLKKKYIEDMIDANKYFIADTIGSLLYG